MLRSQRPARAWCIVLLAAALARPEAALAQSGAAVAFPTGDPRTSVVLIEHQLPREARVGVEIEYVLKITNLTRSELKGLTLNLQFPPELDVRGFDVAPTRADARGGAWDFATFRPESAQALRARVVPTRIGEFFACAAVTFRTESCAPIRVVEPQLALVKEAPAEVILCDRIPLRFVVSNPGSGAARNVVVRDPLPQGWTTEDGRPEITLNAGDLLPGQAKEATVFVRSAATGSFQNTATAASAEGLSAQSSTRTRVVKPELRVTKTSPDVRFLGRPAEFQITVENVGDSVARGTVLTDQMPAGATFLGASDGGTASGNAVTWNLGDLPPGGRRTVTIAMTARQIGQFRNVAIARAYCTEATAEAPLLVRGIPAILLEVIDIDDPIEVGAQNTYEITVTNQGSAEDTNIVVTCELPPQQEFVAAEGAVPFQVNGRTVTFAPLPQLAPQAAAKYRVVVKGLSEGDVRFRTTLTSAQLTQPVEETESTRHY